MNTNQELFDDRKRKTALQIIKLGCSNNKVILDMIQKMIFQKAKFLTEFGRFGWNHIELLYQTYLICKFHIKYNSIEVKVETLSGVGVHLNCQVNEVLFI